MTRKKTFNEIMHEKFASHTSPQAPALEPIDYLECARMDIRGNSRISGDSMIVDMEDVDAVINKLKDERIRSRPAPTAPDNTEQCHTCKHEGTRACMSHGYPEVPKSCQYKLGTHAEESMRNLNGTFIDCWTKAERERVLLKYQNWLAKEAKMAFEGETRALMVRLNSKILKEIESLRGSQEEKING